MDLASITPDLVKRLLNAWLKGELPAEADVAFSFLNATTDLELRLTDVCKRMETETLHYLEAYRKEHHPRGFDAASASVNEKILEDSRAQSMELQSWSAVYYRFFHMQGEPAQFIWKAARIDERRFQRRIRQGYAYLARILRDKEQAARHTASIAEIRTQTNAPETRQLFGPQGRVNEIIRLLLQPSGPIFISIEGLGGIGKTALAWAVVEQVRTRAIPMPGGIAWLSARQEFMSEQGRIEPEKNGIRSTRDIFAQLMEHLAGIQPGLLTFEQQREKLAAMFAKERCLIVIDNVETLDDVSDLLPELARIAGASRFVLTSRVALQSFSPVYTIKVAELTEPESKALILAELNRLNAARTVTPAEISSIYSVVGGIPLALKLVTSQAARLPVEMVLMELQEINTAEPEQRHEMMFRYIYRHLWVTLTDAAKQLLLAMYNLSVEGTNFAGLRSRAGHIGLNDSQFREALQDLQAHSLVEIHGSAPNYSLHRLTTTFLSTDIVNARWTGEA